MNADLQQDIESLTDTVKRFTLERIAPHVSQWDDAGEFPRGLYQEAAALGLLGLGYPEELGGTPAPHALRNAMSITMALHSGSGGLMASLFSLNIGLPPVLRYGSAEVQQEVIAPVLRGEKIAALAITEPGGGSDVASLRATARRDSESGDWIINGEKVFITSGMRADWITMAVRTGDAGSKGAGGISMIVVPGDAKGLSRTKLTRLYTIHVFVVPALIALVMSVHLLIVIKQKHTQPGYARKLAEPGKVLGVPLLPYQALLAGQLLMLMFGALFLLSAVVPPHPLKDFGPPGPTTPEVKPDWYLLWIYGFLKIVPSWTEFRFLGTTFSPNFYGGLLFPTLVFGLMTFAPWLDQTNRRAIRRFEYLEPPRQTPVRLSLGIAVLSFVGTLFLAAYYDEIGMSLGEIWAVVVGLPILVGAAVYLWSRRWAKMMRFEPREEPEDEGEGRGEVTSVLTALDELAPTVRGLRGRELDEARARLDSLRASLGESPGDQSAL